MKKLLLLSAIALIATTASAVEVKPYVEGKISHNWIKADAKFANFYEDGEWYAVQNDDMKDNVFGGGLEVGVNVNQFRLGLEGYYNDKAEDNLWNVVPVQLESKGLFLNSYFDIPLPELKQVKPYVGAGIGYSWLKATSKWEGEKGSSEKKDWSWNVGFGVAYALNDNVDLTLGYRYENLGKIKDDGDTVHFTNSKVTLGLRYTF